MVAAKGGERMKKLNKMLFREIFKSKGQFLAAAAVIFAGISMFAASYMSYQNLKNSVAYYYSQYKFLDYYAETKNLTEEGVRRIEKLDGVRQAVGRISEDVGADMGEDRRMTLRLISLPDNQLPDVNRVFFISGGYFSETLANSCLVDQKFAEFYKLDKGDTIKSIINQKIVEFKVAGVVSSPEAIYAMKSAESVFSSAESFGIIYIKESAARSLLGHENTYNQVHVLFKQGIDEKKVIDRIEDILKSYGFVNGVKRKDQLSNTMIKDEISQLEMMAYLFPALFLSVAAIIIYIMLRRIVNNQRTLIGVMKAFGYTDARIMWHYILYSLLISFCGAIPGILAGTYLGSLMTSMYTQIYNIPVLNVKIYWNILFGGILLSSVFCLLAGFNSAKRVLSIQPAQAMRSEVPKAGRRVFVENISFVWKKLSFSWKMSVRNIFRSRQRAMFTLLGMAFTIMFFMVTIFFLDCVNYVLDKHFFEFQSQDYKVYFSKPAAYHDAVELESIRGVRRVEPVLEMPVELKNAWREKNTMFVGLTRDYSFYRFRNEAQKTVKISSSGIMISDVLAKKLSVKTGDTITFKSLNGDDKKRDVRISGIIKQYIGFNCYMDILQLGKLVEEGLYSTGALMSIEKGMEEKVKEELFKIPGIEMVESRLESYETFQQYMELMYVFIGLMIIFGTIMGFATIFNTTIINIMERRRELASLKVLGYSPREIENTILRENLLLGIIALVPGVVLGRLMCEALAKAFSTELFALDVIIYNRTYIITFICMFLFILLAQWANKKNISGLDMVEVLKNREG
ncbi:MAG: FtsX-like permease family protein [Clostridia bacterium]|nr:FtsX-like permease family protein [Clostridia bacterium]